MTKPEWGLKRKCLSCGAFFYDMKKKEFKCPKCGKEYKAEELNAAKLEAALKSASNIKALQEELNEEELVASAVADVDFQDTDDANDGLLEDASDLGDDDHDMAEVMDNVSTGRDDE